MNQVGDIFVATADRVFGDKAARSADKFDRVVWAATAAAGLDRMLLREEAGGAGEAFEEAVAVARSFGRHAPAIPWIETVVADWCLDQAGLEVPDGPKHLLIRLGSGEALPRGVADEETARSWSASKAGIVTVSAANPGVTVTLFEAVGARPFVNLAGEPFLTMLPIASAPVATGQAEPTIDQCMALLALMKAAGIVGALEAALAMTIDYANTRKQFGRRIGAFQAVQHMIARMAEEVAASLAAVQRAALSYGQPTGLFACAVAKARASEAAGLVCAMAHQCHGAIGFTREHDLHRFTTRALAWRDEVGGEAYWYERIGRAAMEAGSSGLWSGITQRLLL